MTSTPSSPKPESTRTAVSGVLPLSAAVAGAFLSVSYELLMDELLAEKYPADKFTEAFGRTSAGLHKVMILALSPHPVGSVL